MARVSSHIRPHANSSVEALGHDRRALLSHSTGQCWAVRSRDQARPDDPGGLGLQGDPLGHGVRLLVEWRELPAAPPPPVTGRQDCAHAVSDGFRGVGETVRLDQESPTHTYVPPLSVHRRQTI